MNILVVLLLSYQVLAAPRIFSTVAANLQTMTDFNLSIFSPAGTSIVLDQLCFLSLDQQGRECATTVDFKGTLVHHYCYFNYVLDNIAYDSSTKQTFINTYWSNAQKNYVMLLDQATGVLSTVVEVPGIVQVGISTYCPNGHIFFLTLELDSGGNSLVRVDTQNKKVLSNVVVPDAIEILLWDHTQGMMFAWVASEMYAAELVVLDINTGKRLRTIVSYSNLSANGGSATIDLQTKIVYSTLLQLDTTQPNWVIVETISGKSTATTLYKGYPINLALVH